MTKGKPISPTLMTTPVIDRKELGAVWKREFDRLLVELGYGYENLKCCRVPERHGTCTSVFVCRIYDRRQTDATFPYKLCAYSLNYDPDQFETTNHNWCLKLHITTERLYFLKRDGAVSLLEQTLPKVCPKDFAFIRHPRFLCVEHQFTHGGDETAVVKSISGKLRKLIESTYGAFEAALQEASEGVLTREERRTFARVREKAHSRAANSNTAESRRTLNRAIGPALRAKVIASNKDGCCRICGKLCKHDEIDIDHIVSIANGGRTVLSNLQVTCARCNRSKGSGRAKSKVAHVPAKKRPPGWRSQKR